MDIQAGVPNSSTPTMRDITNPDIDQILRGEISAVEAYEQVMKEINDERYQMRIEKILRDHQSAVLYWKTQARLQQKIPESSSAIWGFVVESFVGLSKLGGLQTAFEALKKGEEHGLKEYEELLDSDNISEAQKRDIRQMFITRQKAHLNFLERSITELNSN